MCDKPQEGSRIPSANRRVIAVRTVIVDSALQGFMREHSLIRRSTKYTIYIDLNRTVSLMSDLREKLSKAEAREDSLSKTLKEKEGQLRSMESRLVKAEANIKTLEEETEAREREISKLRSSLSDATSKLSKAESRIKDLERQLKERQKAVPESSEP